MIGVETYGLIAFLIGAACGYFAASVAHADKRVRLQREVVDLRGQVESLEDVLESAIELSVARHPSSKREPLRVVKDES